MRSFFPVLVATAVAISPCMLSAQVDTGSIVGTVKDATGAVLPDATVVLTSVGTVIKTVVKTGPTGTYAATIQTWVLRVSALATMREKSPLPLHGSARFSSL